MKNFVFATLVVVLLASCNSNAAEQETTKTEQTTDSTATKLAIDSTATTTVSK